MYWGCRIARPPESVDTRVYTFFRSQVSSIAATAGSVNPATSELHKEGSDNRHKVST